jgi:hypothetical protein
MIRAQVTGEKEVRPPAASGLKVAAGLAAKSSWRLDNRQKRRRFWHVTFGKFSFRQAEDPKG